MFLEYNPYGKTFLSVCARGIAGVTLSRGRLVRVEEGLRRVPRVKVRRFRARGVLLSVVRGFPRSFVGVGA